MKAPSGPGPAAVLLRARASDSTSPIIPHVGCNSSSSSLQGGGDKTVGVPVVGVSDSFDMRRRPPVLRLFLPNVKKKKTEEIIKPL